MKKIKIMIAAAMLLMPLLCTHAEELEAGLAGAIGQIDLTQLEEKTQEEGIEETVLRLARGETVWSVDEIMEKLKSAALGELRGSFDGMLRLIAPSLLCALAGMLQGKGRGSAGIAENACFLSLAAVIAGDLQRCLLAAEENVVRMDEIMQALFPLLLTLLAAVGATSGSALYQPAIAAASGTMTTLVRSVSLPLAMGVAVITLLDSLTEGMHLRRLAGVMRSAATWTLGIAFTVFIGVTALQGMTVSAADGVSIRAAKYAVDQFVPVVGGMFADTMDTLAACSLLIKNALGVTGLMLLFSAGARPMLGTLCAALMYKLCAALLQPIAKERISGVLHGFSDVLTLLFVIQLSVGAMFLLLTAQLIAVGGSAVMLR